MMTRYDDCAFPAGNVADNHGLTKREYFAAQALAGLIMLDKANLRDDSQRYGIATLAVAMANELVQALNSMTHDD